MEGVVLASIAGNNNLSLQNWTADSTIPTSITFSGNNTEYNGTLYLHPSINTITFANKKSIIKNINFPQPDDESRKEVHLTFKDSTNDIKTLTISDNLTCNIQGNINLNTLNLNNTNALKLSNSSNINLGNTEGAIVNISSEKYEVKESPTLFATLKIGTVTVKYDYTDEKQHYDYENISCGTCNSTINNITNSETNTDSILSSIRQCSNTSCNKTFNNVNVGIIQSYLYPKSVDEANCDTYANLYCSNCSNDWLAYVLATFDETNNKYISLGDYYNSGFDSHKPIYNGCGISLIYDPNYVLEQLNKGYRLGKITLFGD